jgi:hypothetical protein
VETVCAVTCEKFHREVVGIGCAAHIVHSCLQRAVDVLHTVIEVFAVKIHKYFHVSTVEILVNFMEC